MHITIDLLNVMQACAEAAHEQAEIMLDFPEAKQDNSVGRILKTGAEKMHQNADVLAGWVLRTKKELFPESIESKH